MYKIALLLLVAVLAVATAQYISPYYTSTVGVVPSVYNGVVRSGYGTYGAYGAYGAAYPYRTLAYGHYY